MFTQFHWTPKRTKAALALAEGQSHQAVAEAILDWLKYAQSETTGFKFGFSRGELAEMDAQFDALWWESVEEEVNRRLTERRPTVEVQPANERLLR